MGWTRLRALILKELLAVLRDPRGRMILIVPPLVQLVVFSLAATLEVTNVDLGLLNRDGGRWSAELTQRLAATPIVRSLRPLHDPDAVREAIDRQAVLAVLEIGPTFSRDIEAGRPAELQVILDGRRSNASQIVAGYLDQIVRDLAAETPAGRRAATVTPRPEVRTWFNPNLTYPWFMVPSLAGVIAMLMGLTVTALSIARERELGTFDQLLVSPLRTHEILLGKVIPPLLIGLTHMTLFILAAVLVFGVPLRGSLLLLYGCGLVFLASVIGIGLLISALSATQQQAILGTFLFMVPAMLLSGFATPIDNMPDWLQPLTLVDPLRYFLVVVKGIFLKDLPAAAVLANTLPLAAIAVVSLGAAAWLFRRRLG